jgi:hypothetical protein
VERRSERSRFPIAETRLAAGHTRFGLILSAKLVESRTPNQTTVFAKWQPGSRWAFACLHRTFVSMV